MVYDYSLEDDMGSDTIKGRGAQIQPKNRFLKNSYHVEDEFLEHCHKEEEVHDPNQTEYIEVFPKTIVNKVDSPDLGLVYSMNPYQGCEHGCIYCYARGTHDYWGYSSGTDFERKILVKPTAPELLAKELSARNYKPYMIMLSGNTDCYQPIERKLKITRGLLEVCLAARNPVGVITKNSLILRDLDLLKQLNEHGLLRVTLSITSLDEKLRRALEPRTASIKQKLKTLRTLSENGIAVNVNMAPVIPGLNEHEIMDLVRTVAEHGAKSVAYILVRLSWQNDALFSNWLEHHFPDRKQKVLNAIRECREGKLNDTRFGHRMRGVGTRAEHIKQVFKLARAQFIPPYEYPDLNYQDFRPISNGQLNLF